MLVLFDGNNLVHRLWHAMQSLTTKDGRVSGVVFGVLREILSCGDSAPVFCWDSPHAKERRRKIWSGYKIRRVTADTAVFDEIPKAKEIIASLGLVQLECPGLEADDVIGLAAGWGDGEAVILSTDMDLAQLVTDDVLLLRAVRGRKQYISPKLLKQEYGVTPGQWVRFRAMTGDTSDGIPGIPGIGPVKAARIVNSGEDVPSCCRDLVARNEKLIYIPRRLEEYRREPDIYTRAKTLNSVLSSGRRRSMDLYNEFVRLCAGYELKTMLERRMEFWR